MTFRLPKDSLHRHSNGRRAGFLDAVLHEARHDGDHIVIESEHWLRLAWEYRGDPSPTEPTVTELAANFAGAMGRWTAAGFPTVTREAYDQRAAVCDACEHWDGAARLGLGKCGAPGCGCTGLKRWLATERCPLGKWSTL